MTEKTYKYAEHLNQHKNCPPPTCSETERDIYRWVHKKPSEANFVPVPLMPYQRLIDDRDKRYPCHAYSLSVWETLQIAREKFLEQYKRQPPNKQGDYIANRGDSVALIPLTQGDGVLSENKGGHFSLFEYTGVELHKNITEILSIFD